MIRNFKKISLNRIVKVGFMMSHFSSNTAVELTAAEKYLFDTSGYIILRNVLTEEEVNAANTAIEKRIDQLHERTGKLRCSTLYGRESDNLAGDGKTGRFDMGGMLGWEKPDCDPFRSILAHRRLIPMLHTLVGTGYRLDHSPLLLAMETGSEGHTLHGGAITESGTPAWHIAYDCRLGKIHNQLLTVCVQLTDTAPGDGGFCIVPGSHKSNFPIPPALADYHPDFQEYVVQPCPQKGDVLVFTEAALHGTLPWIAPDGRNRRTVIYRFAPANVAYGRGYAHTSPVVSGDGEKGTSQDQQSAAALKDERIPAWPNAFTRGMTEAQLAVMQPPFNVRLNRRTLSEVGEVVYAKPRESFKVEFDEKVFGSKYF